MSEKWLQRRVRLPHILLVVVATMIAGCRSTPKSEVVAKAVTTYQSKIREIITDPARAEMLVQLVDQAVAQRNAAESAAAVFLENFERLNADYDATKAQFTSLLATHRNERRQIAEALLSIRAKMVAGTTPKEWESLSKVREKALDTIFTAELPDGAPAELVAKIGGAPC
jgi:outer membrane murein-binding lipoprotein Lpp